jgi:hypothetical protein
MKSMRRTELLPLGIRQRARLREAMHKPWWDAPTLLEMPCPVCTETLAQVLEEEKPQVTAVSLDLDEDQTIDRQAILTLIEAGARNHLCKCGEIPGQIKHSPICALMGLPAYFIFENTIIPLREDATLQPNAIQCFSSRAFIL